MPNPFAHVELSTVDLKKAKKFYGSLFGWQLNDIPGMNYTMIDTAGGTGGGMQTNPNPGAPSAWLPYVTVESVAKTLAKATKAGATVVMGHTPIGDMGAIGILVDPMGATLGIWEPGPAAKAKEAEAAKPKKAKASKKKAPAAKATKAARKAARKR
jgi:uncharacterized protein